MGIRHWLVAAAVMISLSGTAQAAGIPGQGTWETTLKARDINGRAVDLDDASAVFFYDTTFKITWLKNWDVNGSMTWSQAMNWASALNVGGFTGWGLPTINVTTPNGTCSEPDCGYNVDTANSALAHMWYEKLGNVPFCDSSGNCPQPGWGLTNTGPFENMREHVYWTGTVYAPLYFGFSWSFDTRTGLQRFDDQVSTVYAVAVRPGDVAAIPEPQAVALMLVGLGMLMVVRRRRPG